MKNHIAELIKFRKVNTKEAKINVLIKDKIDTMAKIRFTIV